MTIYEKITQLFPNLSPVTLIIISMLCLLTAIGMIVSLEKQRMQYVKDHQMDLWLEQQERTKQTYHQKLKQYTYAKIPVYTCILFMTLLLVCSIKTCSLAISHGCTQNQLQTQNTKTIWDNIHRTPKEDCFPTDTPKDAILIYYRFGCDDCELLYDSLQSAFKDIPNVYWIDTRSKQGKQLRETYPVKNVPSGIAIQDTNHTLLKVLYEKNKETIRLDTNAVSELIRYQNGGTTWQQDP